MPRLLAVVSGLCLLATTGCIWHHTQTPAELAAHQQRSIEKKIAIDQQRLLGEDKGHPTNRPTVILGVDVSGESPYWGFFHVLVMAPVKFYDRFTTHETPKQFAHNMELVDSPDLQREAILKLAGYSFGRRPPYTTRYDQIADTLDEDFTVRAAAIRALNRARDHRVTPICIRILDEWLHRIEAFRMDINNPEERPLPPDDRQWLIRLEAAKALANIPDENAVPVLIRDLSEDDNKDVRIACADALRNYHTLETTRVLIQAMSDRDFGVVWQAHQSLIVMTGHDFQYDQEQWLKYFNQNPKPFT